MSFFPAVQSLLSDLKTDSDNIATNRLSLLSGLKDRLKAEIASKRVINVAFICTHNSRRSHISQLLAHLLVHHFKIANIACYSAERRQQPLMKGPLRLLSFMVLRLP